MNIHPTKTEIKFENEQAIWQILSAAVKESLGKFSAIPTSDFDTEDMPDIPAFEQARPIEPPKVHYNTDFNPFKTSSASSYGGGGNYSRPKVEWEGLYSGLEKASRMNEPMEEEPFVEDTVTGRQSHRDYTLFVWIMQMMRNRIRDYASVIRISPILFFLFFESIYGV